jgi:hypothetical protein
MQTLTLFDDSKTAFINKASLPHIFDFVLALCWAVAVVSVS